jgi:hypothetical protein
MRAYWHRHPAKRAAHCAVSNAIRAGRIMKAPCESCGNEKAQAHHDDYDKPLDVMWLARSTTPSATASFG